MLQNKSTTIVSEVKGFFTSTEKATNVILNILSSLTLSEKQIGLQSKNNNEYKNINKLLLVLLFPFFDIKDAWQYGKSSLFPVLGCGKDVFYRLLNDNFIAWRKISFKISMQLIGRTSTKSNETGTALGKFIKSRRIGCHLLGMAKMGKTRYLFNDKKLTAKEIIDYHRKTKKLKRSKQLACYYSQAMADFNGIPVKLFFCKTSRRGKWHLLLATDLKLNFEQARKIYST